MAIDPRTVDVEAEDGQVEGLSELTDAQMQARGWLTTDPREAPVGYWRIPDVRMVRGRIDLQQYGRNSDDNLDREGYARLRQYGTYKSNGGPGSWQPWRDPWLGIVQTNGLKEFDPQQIVDLGWHRRPTRQDHPSHQLIWRKIQALMAGGAEERAAIDAVFPQLRGRVFTDVECQRCPGRWFSEPAHRETHESIMHAEAIRDREIRAAIGTSISEGGKSNAELLALLTETVARLAGSSDRDPKARKP